LPLVHLYGFLVFTCNILKNTYTINRLRYQKNAVAPHLKMEAIHGQSVIPFLVPLGEAETARALE
jgi:hypothetical protein